MDRTLEPPVLAVPAPLLDVPSSVWCPWCRSACSALRDESGSPGPVLEMFHYDPPAGDGPIQDDRGRVRGWAYLIPHLCRSKLAAFAGPTSIRTGEGGGA